AVHARRPALREHVRRPHPAAGLHARDVVPDQRGHRPAVERYVVRPDGRADGVRTADPGAAGLHLHDPDRAVHRWLPRSGALMFGSLMFYVPAGGMSAGNTEKESTDA